MAWIKLPGHKPIQAAECGICHAKLFPASLLAAHELKHEQVEWKTCLAGHRYNGWTFDSEWMRCPICQRRRIQNGMAHRQASKSGYGRITR